MCICVYEADQLVGAHALEGGAMMGKDYMLAILILNYDGEAHTLSHTHTHKLVTVISEVQYSGTSVYNCNLLFTCVCRAEQLHAQTCEKQSELL